MNNVGIVTGSRDETTAIDGDEFERLDDSVEFAYQSLRREILSGELQPGSVLSQVQLAARLGTSRTPLREALRRLTTENLVVADFNRRMRVSELNLEDFDQIYAIRIALEPIGIASTLPTLTSADERTLGSHVTAMDEAIQATDFETFRLEHRAFHLGLTDGVGGRISRLLADLWDNSERYRLTYLHHGYEDPLSEETRQLHISQAEHHRMLDAAGERDVEACTELVLAHLHRSLELVFTAASQPRPRISARALQRSMS